MNASRLAFRSWFYFRVGYGTYLTFVVAGANLLVTSYYLAVQNVASLRAAFDSFTLFVVFALAVGIPVAVLLGYAHIKRTPAWTTELDISAEANPYNYKLPPGYWREVLAPAYLQLLRQTAKLLDKEGLLDQETRGTLATLERKLDALAQGGSVGAAGRKLPASES